MQTRGRMKWTMLAAACVTLALAGAAVAQDSGTKKADVPKDSPYSGLTAGDVTKDSGKEKDKEKDKGPSLFPGLRTVLTMLLWLGVVVVFIYAAVWLIRKYVPSARGMMGAGALKVVSRSYVSAKQSILLVKVGERFVLVGVTPTAMTPLTEITDAEEARRLTEELASGQEGPHSKSFRSELRKADELAAKGSDAAPAVRDAEVREVSREIDAVREKINDWRGKTKA